MTQRLEVELAKAGERLKLSAEQSEYNEQLMHARFASLAAEALEQNSQRISEQSRMQISELIAPVKANLEEFRRAYTDAIGKESEKRAVLEEQLKELFAVSRAVGDDARRLSDALRGNNAVQGDWGEMVLENILERSGLTPGQDYEIQKTIDTDISHARPDVIIRCPGNRNIIIDSKVSMSDYMRMLSADDRKIVKAAGDAHVSSIRKHVGELRRKNYQDLLDGRAADFVMMFVPNEGAYLAAMQLDGSLWQSAFESRVIIVSPTHVVSVVKLVEMMWRQEKQNRNALEIAELGGKMMDKLTNFLSDMGKIDSSLTAAQKAYQSAMTRLEGRGGIKSIGEAMRAKGIKGKQ